MQLRQRYHNSFGTDSHFIICALDKHDTTGHTQAHTQCELCFLPEFYHLFNLSAWILLLYETRELELGQNKHNKWGWGGGWTADLMIFLLKNYVMF